MEKYIKCENCGEMVDSSADFCPVCYKRLHENVADNNEDIHSEESDLGPIPESKPEKPEFKSFVFQNNKNRNDSFKTPKPKKNEKESESIKKVVMVVLSAVIVLGIGCLIGSMIRQRKDDSINNQPANTTSEPKVTQNTTDDQQIDGSDQNSQVSETADNANESEDITLFGEDNDSADALIRYGIDKDSKLNYDTGLDPNSYKRFDGTDLDMDYFGYFPADIFCDCELVETDTASQYGISKNKITFTTSEGGYLTYEYIERTDSGSIEDFTDHIYSSEEFRLNDFNKILRKYPKKDGHGTLVLTGMIGENGIYEVFRIKNNCVMRMEYAHTPYYSFDDKAKGWYITECLYRMCGFSGNTQELRSYEEFYNADNTGLRD